ncbi:MAG: sugar ABC transporter permease [Candidatus Edwardsbacteria bacterium]|nr:sugar ABC transporter permease [Candidatus Edwardsbacteria bacterium]MBU1577700.1 sugar ABC transporter permease [Candidatus Edwardsbacteria bacterium]MBU2463131.1 sugar ABC transporter permease [Candidatus Edwardsbacteria bacterium]MBU2594599.1 sugar ABC transporter permease [Candidatus Edwardsbacteria bacterium]
MVGANRKLPYLLLLPALAVIVLVLLVPLGYCFYLSLFKHSLGTGIRDFIGLNNYIALLGDHRFTASVFRTMLFVSVTLTLEISVGFGLALMMHSLVRGRGLVRAVVMIPWAVPTVIAAMIWGWMFNDRLGLANRLLDLVGLIPAPLVWLADPALTWTAIVMAEVWKTAPFVALIILAGLQMIPIELYQAAEVDGAGAFQKFRMITLPLLWPTILLALLFRTIDALRVFDLIMVMTGGGPAGSTEVLSLYNYKTLFSHLDFGYGSAMSMALFLLVMSFSLVYVRMMARRAL